MKNPDARTLSSKVFEEKRQAAHALRKRNMTRVEIGAIVGVHPDTVGRWLKLSPESLELKRRGRKVGVGRLLTENQAKAIRRKIIDKTPDQLKLDYALWTRRSVQELIMQEFHIE